MLQKLKPGRLLRITQVPTALHVNHYTTTLNCVHLNYTFSLAISYTKSPYATAAAGASVPVP
jgi:hypothetical protein